MQRIEQVLRVEQRAECFSGLHCLHPTRLSGNESGFSSPSATLITYVFDADHVSLEGRPGSHLVYRVSRYYVILPKGSVCISFSTLPLAKGVTAWPFPSFVTPIAHIFSASSQLVHRFNSERWCILVCESELLAT